MEVTGLSCRVKTEKREKKKMFPAGCHGEYGLSLSNVGCETPFLTSIHTHVHVYTHTHTGSQRGSVNGTGHARVDKPPCGNHRTRHASSSSSTTQKSLSASNYFFPRWFHFVLVFHPTLRLLSSFAFY